jgi:hypothetical protein
MMIHAPRRPGPAPWAAAAIGFHPQVRVCPEAAALAEPLRRQPALTPRHHPLGPRLLLRNHVPPVCTKPESVERPGPVRRVRVVSVRSHPSLTAALGSGNSSGRWTASPDSPSIARGRDIDRRHSRPHDQIGPESLCKGNSHPSFFATWERYGIPKATNRHTASLAAASASSSSSASGRSRPSCPVRSSSLGLPPIHQRSSGARSCHNSCRRNRSNVFSGDAPSRVYPLGNGRPLVQAISTTKTSPRWCGCNITYKKRSAATGHS